MPACDCNEQDQESMPLFQSQTEALAHYQKRIVRIVGPSRSNRLSIEWICENGKKRRSAVKPENLRPLRSQLF